jgi:hypothetical protein
MCAAIVGVVLGLAAAPLADAVQQPPPVPKPFPATTTPGTPPLDPSARPASSAPPSAAQLPPAPAGTPPELAGVPIYPSSEFLDSFDAGRGQRYYLFGTNAPYADIVLYYKNVLRNSSNRELFKQPAMQQFDLGRFQEETMAYPPSVVVKDYTWNGSSGYLFVAGTSEKRFKTIIQIVPAAGPVK